jgi:hypothetical protein
MIALEQQLIGALLNAPDKARQALNVRPEHFEDPYLGAIKAVIDAADGRYDVGTVIADMQNHPGYDLMGGRDYIARLYVHAPEYAVAVEPAARKVVEAWQRRQAVALLDQQARDIASGHDVHAVLAGYRPRFEALGRADAARFRPLAIADMVLPAVPWRIRGLMPRTGLGFCAGASGAGKSFFTLDVSLRLAHGDKTILGRPATGCGVLYIATEDATGCMARVQAWRRHANAPADIPFELLPAGIDLNDPACVGALSDTLRATAERFAGYGSTLGLVVVDTLSRALPGCDENSAADMSRAVVALETLAEASGAFVLAVAHHGKSGDRGIRGWSGMNAASDMTLSVTRDDADPALRIVTLSKIKNAGDGADIRFRLKPVGTGAQDADGHELQSCVCAFEGAPEPVDTEADAIVAAVRHAVRHFESYAVAANLARAPGARAVDFHAVRTQALKSGLARGATAAAGERRFTAALDRLVAGNRIGVDPGNALIWLT